MTALCGPPEPARIFAGNADARAPAMRLAPFENAGRPGQTIVNLGQPLLARRPLLARQDSGAVCRC